MTAPRIYPREVVEDVRRRVEAGETIRSIATFHGMSPSTVSNMSRGLIYSDKPRQKRHSKEHLDSIRDLSATRAKRIRAAKQAERVQLAKTTTLVEQAKAERDSGRPLVVETLEEKLAKAIPGAYVVGGRTCDDPRAPFAVWCSTHRLSTGCSKREAVDRAISLWGAR